MQRGSIRKLHGSWHVRFRVSDVGPDGQPRRRLVTKRIAPVNDFYRNPTSVQTLADDIVKQETHSGSADGSMFVDDFVARFYLPFVEARKSASTLRFYRDTIKRHISPVIGHLRLLEVRTVHVQRLLDAQTDLSQGSLKRIKSSASAVFSHARRLDFITGVNPAQGARAEGKRSTFEGVAYTLDDLEYFLKKLDEPARTVTAVAAFTGLRLSEIRGLRWEDYDGQELHVRRSVWRTFEGETKTADSKASVPVIAPLRTMLEEHRKRNGTSGWIFAGEKKGFALNLDNLARRVILPAVGERWCGWQGWRRGLATVLFDLGVDPEVASKILRHADSAVTRRHYIILESKKQGSAAMKKFESLVAQKSGSGKSKNRRKPA